jgi:carbonic anhydrase
MKGANTGEVLALLLAGNRRFVAGESLGPRATRERRSELVHGQHPSAVVVTCSDSRVPPEIVFDLGLGDLFVVRAAGNVLDEAGLASVEYAVRHLGVRLVIVMGHTRCGAVEAAVRGGDFTGPMAKLISHIEPAVRKARERAGDAVENAVRQNVAATVAKLEEAALRSGFDSMELAIVGALYRLESGTVEILHVASAGE